MTDKPTILGRPATWWHCEDVKLTMSEKRLAAWARAVITTESKFGDYYAFGHGSRDSWSATVLVIDGRKEQFEKVAGVELCPPPRIQVGSVVYP